MFCNHNYSADDEAERKKKKKIRMTGQQLRQAPGSHGFESVERVKKTNAGFKQNTPIVQPRLTAKDNFNMDTKEVHACSCFWSVSYFRRVGGLLDGN